MTSLAMEALQFPSAGLSEEERYQHNHEELLRVFPDSPAYVAEFSALEPYKIMIKIGGEMIMDEALINGLVVMQDHGITPVVVHGGGPQIKRAIENSGDTTNMSDGVRITPPQHMPYVVDALQDVNDSLLEAIDSRGGSASGVSGVFEGIPRSATDIVLDTVLTTHTEEIKEIACSGKIAVVSCLGKVIDIDQQANLNGDTAAGSLAIALGAEKYLSVTKEGAVRDKNQGRIPKLTPDMAADLILNGVIRDGMSRKVIDAVRLNFNGVHDVVLTRDPLQELFTNEGEGTIVHLNS